VDPLLQENIQSGLKVDHHNAARTTANVAMTISLCLDDAHIESQSTNLQKDILLAR